MRNFLHELFFAEAYRGAMKASADTHKPLSASIKQSTAAKQAAERAKAAVELLHQVLTSH